MGATVANVIVTMEELERLPEDGLRREILRGELMEVPPAKSGHAIIATRIYDFLRTKPLGRVLMEAGYPLFPDRKTWPQPDVSFYRAGRASSVKADEYFQGAPEVAFDVISPSESASEIEAKVEEAYLEAGGLGVVLVLVFPDLGRVRMCLWMDGQLVLKEHEVVELGGVLPGWRMPVRAMFEDVAEGQ